MEKTKDQIEFMRKVAHGLEDYKNSRVHSFQDTFDAVDEIINAEKE